MSDHPKPPSAPSSASPDADGAASANSLPPTSPKKEAAAQTEVTAEKPKGEGASPKPKPNDAAPRKSAEKPGASKLKTTAVKGEEPIDFTPPTISKKAEGPRRDAPTKPPPEPEKKPDSAAEESPASKQEPRSASGWRRGLAAVESRLRTPLLLLVLGLYVLILANRPSESKPPPAVGPSDLRDAVAPLATTAGLNTGLTGVRDAMGTNRLTPDHLKDVAKQLDEIKKTVPTRETLDKIHELLRAKGTPGAAPPSPEAREQMDVFVLALHSQNLAINEYLKAFESLFEGRTQKPSDKYRLGFYVGLTGELRTKVAVKDGKVSDASFNVYPSNGNQTERPDEVGQKLVAEFDPSRPNRRCLLVASTQCPVPATDGAGWKGMAVDVVLIQAARVAAKPEANRLAQWQEFCADHQGGLVYFRPKDGDPAHPRDKQLYQHLYRLAQSPPARK